MNYSAADYHRLGRVFPRSRLRERWADRLAGLPLAALLPAAGPSPVLVYGPVTVAAALASSINGIGQSSACGAVSSAAVAFGSETAAAVPIGSLAAEARV